MNRSLLNETACPRSESVVKFAGRRRWMEKQASNREIILQARAWKPWCNNDSHAAWLFTAHFHLHVVFLLYSKLTLMVLIESMLSNRISVRKVSNFTLMTEFAAIERGKASKWVFALSDLLFEDCEVQRDLCKQNLIQFYGLKVELGSKFNLSGLALTWIYEKKILPWNWFVLILVHLMHREKKYWILSNWF